MSLIYLDNNATTPLLPEAWEEVCRVARDAFGNPGSRHVAGRQARRALEAARETVAEVLDADPSEVIFTSGGTESINLAIAGLSRTRGGTERVIVSPPGEHPATTGAIKRVGLRHVEWPIDSQGRIVPGVPPELAQQPVALVSVLWAHNETGVIQDLSPMAAWCAQNGIPWHIDAVQAVGKIDLSFRQLGATAVSLAAHKFHGPRGVGALLLRRDAEISSNLGGGHQERGLRPGTEPVALAAGMAMALRLWQRDREDRQRRMRELRDRLERGLFEAAAPIVINGANAFRLPNTSSVAFPGCSAEALLVALELEQVCCSHGSACSSGSSEPAPILVAMRASREVQLSTLRLSVSCLNSLEEIDEAVRRIARVVQRLRARGLKSSGPAESVSTR